MSLSRRLGRAAQQLGPSVSELAPQYAATFVQQALDRAVHGFGPLDGAALVAERERDAQGGDLEATVTRLIEDHVRLAGAQGFVTNLGGLATMAVAVPANIAGLAMLQCRLVAAIAHLRGYDLADPRTRNAVLTALLGEEKLHELVRRRQLPGTPMVLATAPVHDPHLDTLVANEVASELMTRVAGKRLASTVGRRVPVVGGLVGASTDGYATWKIGRYVDRELLPRRTP
ncbi:EcsC protein family protein [Nocardioides scoriae]|uniref:EcsC protein family protein n=1 Tax=Nocardioides scoriae TaxID=642780 RepID=A0A1H1UU80_9ACTN|nr:EcsC family protein [Nocardioides scoriae]SDS76102.1 EcsC protein family protein [Nocardioides scoriae]